jgi:hypothetical protein
LNLVFAGQLPRLLQFEPHTAPKKSAACRLLQTRLCIGAPLDGLEKVSYGVILSLVAICASKGFVFRPEPA